MANVRTLDRSFNGGELTPEFFGQISDAKYQDGLAICRNFIPLPHGPATNRPGFAFVRAVKDGTKKTRLIPFAFSTTQTMVIEMGVGYIRFHTQGATVLSGGVPYEIANPYVEADLFDIHYVQSADVMTLVHPNYPPKELRRLGGANWTLTDISFVSSLATPTGVSVTATGWTTTATGASGASTIVCASISGIALGQTPTGAGIAAGATVVGIAASTGTITLSAANSGAVSGIITFYGPTTYKYKVTAMGATGIDESLASSEVTCTNNLLVANTSNTIVWSAVAGAQRYKVYKFSSGLYGYIGQTDQLSFIDDNITADMGSTVAITNNPFSGAGNYPGAASYFEQRRTFAGTTNAPQNLWMTRSGTESNLSYSLPTQDDDAISFRVAAREANTIRHIVPLTNLVLLTSSAEWRVTSLNSDAITPTTVSVRPQSYIGASNVQPVIINNNLIYAAARGGHMRELAYNWQASGYVTGDLSLRAPHLFDNRNIMDMAYAKSPQPIVWGVSSNGWLLGLTYVPEQNIGAWHRHDTDGTFESCAVVAEGDEDVLYVVVKRTINGSSVRYVERMASRQFATPADAFFVDSGATLDTNNTSATTVTVSGGTTWGNADVLTITASAALFTYPGSSDIDDAIVFTAADGTQYRLTILGTTSTTVATARADKVLAPAYRNTATTAYAFARNTISGLSWLEGKTVSVLADGAAMSRQVVTGGSITLPRAAIKIHVGLPIQADLQTMPFTAQIDGGFGQGRVKNINKIWLRVWRSSGIFAGPTADLLVEAKQRSGETYGTPPALKYEEIPIVLMPQWQSLGQVFVRQNDPLPLTVVSMTMEVVIGS